MGPWLLQNQPADARPDSSVEVLTSYNTGTSKQKIHKYSNRMLNFKPCLLFAFYDSQLGNRWAYSTGPSAA